MSSTVAEHGRSLLHTYCHPFVPAANHTTPYSHSVPAAESSPLTPVLSDRIIQWRRKLARTKLVSSGMHAHCTLSACQNYLPVTQGGHPTPIPLSPRKHRLGPDTNISPLSVDKSNKKTKKASPRTPDEKLKVVFDQLKELHWTLGQFMYHLFRLDDEKGQRVHRKSQHAAFVQQFLKGNTEPGIGFMLDAWMRNPDGVLSNNSPDCDLMFNTSVPYSEIKAVRPALTSFAAQSVKKKLVREAEDAVRPGSGLHTTKSVWSDIGTWGESLSTDPSTLGHSAAKIGRSQPANLKKVDYYPHSELAYLILDIRMLDCWRCV